MKIGIFMAIGVVSDIRNEGLGRYMAYLLKGFLAGGNSVTVACPIWLIKPLGLLFEDKGIDIGDIQLITVPQPVSISIYTWIKTRKIKPKRPGGRFKRLVGGIVFEAVSAALSVTNALLFLFLAILMAGLTVLALPFFLAYLLVTNFGRILQRIKKIFRPKTTGGEEAPVPARNKIPTAYMAYLSKIFSRILARNIVQLTHKINNLDCVDVWYSPFVPVPAFNKIKGVKVMNVPDLVTTVLPYGFTGLYMQEQTDNAREAIRNERFFVTYSAYVRDSTLIKDFNKDKADIAVVNHAVNNLNKHINIYENTKHMGFPKEINYNYARDRVCGVKDNALLPDVDNVPAYIRGLNLKDVRYIFYASQIRPSKNIIALLNAYEYVLRRQFGQVKLILTGNYARNPGVRDHIIDRRLQYDVLSFSGVTEDLLACLYASAELVVNPTLYEGAFPFTFGEGMSVGTPSVMGRIPQTEEALAEFGDCSDFLFDPYDWTDMAEKIMYGLAHRDALYDRQLRIYEVMAKRTWNEVAEEYTQAFALFKATAQRTENT